MIAMLRQLLRCCDALLPSRIRLEAEILRLRQQLIVLRRQRRGRVRVPSENLIRCDEAVKAVLVKRGCSCF